MEELGDHIQAIFCKCGKMFAASREPYCYKDADWLSNLSQYIANGCTIKMLNINDNLKIDNCICETKIQLKTYDIDVCLTDTYSIEEFSDKELISEVISRAKNYYFSGHEVDKLLNLFNAVREEDIKPFVIEPNTIIDEMKLEHIVKIFHKYDLAYIENKLP